jgi:SAM-dependent methyltransferase
LDQKDKAGNYKFDWDSYYKNKSNEIPRDTVLKVIEIFEKENPGRKNLFAIDIGCGHGADTIELLKNDWKVLAIDKEANGLSILKDSIGPGMRKNLILSKQKFENIKLKKCDLINASYSLPFCKPAYFNNFWKVISGSIKTGGRFSGNFFGKKDSWSSNNNLTFHTITQVKKLFDKFNIEYFHERDEDGTTTSGEEKHWHVFSVIARKIKS